MNQKLLDFDKVIKVIQSCITSRQNTVAYRMCWQFHNMYKEDTFSLKLFRECDSNLIDIVQGRRS